MAAMAQIGAQIQKNSDGSVNTLKTLESIAKIFPTLRPEQQKSTADALGLTPELLALMREGERMKKLLAKSDEFGLTVDPALNQQLSEVNGTMNELSASWDGLWARSKNKALKTILSDGSVKDGLEDLVSDGSVITADPPTPARSTRVTSAPSCLSSLMLVSRWMSAFTSLT